MLKCLPPPTCACSWPPPPSHVLETSLHKSVLCCHLGLQERSPPTPRERDTPLLWDFFSMRVKLCVQGGLSRQECTAEQLELTSCTISHVWTRTQLYTFHWWPGSNCCVRFLGMWGLSFRPVVLISLAPLMVMVRDHGEGICANHNKLCSLGLKLG